MNNFRLLERILCLFRGAFRSSKGQSAVEFALVIPLFMLIAVAGLDIATMISVTHRLAAATREGARLATESTDPPFSGQTQQAAIARTRRVMTDSGVPWWEANVSARWQAEFAGNVIYYFLEVRAETEPPFFFGRIMRTLGFEDLPTTVSASATGYAEDTSRFFGEQFDLG